MRRHIDDWNLMETIAGREPAGETAVLYERPAWHADAACRGMGTGVFFPGTGEGLGDAKAICDDCPVRLICLEAAMSSGEQHGIWGGLSERQRRKLRRKRAGAGMFPLTCRECGADFMGRTPNAAYCSDECSVAGGRRIARGSKQPGATIETRVCACCGTEFAGTLKTIYCGEACVTINRRKAQARWRERKRAERKGLAS